MSEVCSSISATTCPISKSNFIGLEMEFSDEIFCDRIVRDCSFRKCKDLKNPTIGSQSKLQKGRVDQNFSIYIERRFLFFCSTGVWCTRGCCISHESPFSGEHFDVQVVGIQEDISLEWQIGQILWLVCYHENLIYRTFAVIASKVFGAS